MVTRQSHTDHPGFSAIADPTRRAILDLLKDGELPAGDIAARFPVSRPAIARHVGVLKRAGLLTERRVSRARIYALNPEGLAAIDRWISPYRLFWAARLGDLKQLAESLPTEDTDHDRTDP